ncbi:MAG: hypothetical protein FJW31_27605 [Acidobacteria bacterium]|nr:hypothetical protein [Acidobacteriota bacterium]
MRTSIRETRTHGSKRKCGLKRLLFLLTLGAGLLPGAAVVIPSCASLTTFQDLISAGQCTAGIFTVKNPTVSFLPDGVLASDILISVSATADNVNFSLSGGVFSSLPGQNRSFQLGYTFDPPPDIIKGVSGGIEESGQDFGNYAQLDLDEVNDAVFVNYFLCAGAAFTDGCIGGEVYGFSLNRENSNLFLDGGIAFDSLLTNGVIFRTPVNKVGVLLSIDLNDGGFLGPLTTGFPIADVPEPAKMGLAGLAGLLVAMAPRRRRG